MIESVPLSGLSPGTTYHYRLVATDSPLALEGKAITSPTGTFRTFPIQPGGLPDGRGYELVSPGQEQCRGGGSGVCRRSLRQEVTLRIAAAAESGDAVTYTSWTSFGKPQGAPSSSQYLSKRTKTGWDTENISPFGFIKQPLDCPTAASRQTFASAPSSPANRRLPRKPSRVSTTSTCATTRPGCW